MKKTIFAGRIKHVMAEEEIEQTKVEAKPKESLKDAILHSDSPIARGAGFLEKNKKLLSIIGGGVVIVVLGYFLYNEFIYKPKDLKSQEALWHSESALFNEDYNAAISGDSIGNPGLKSVAESYSGYSGGEIAKYLLGIAYLNNIQFLEAITALEEVAFEDEMVASITLGAIGDANMELGKITAAADYYEKAYNNSKNDLTTPIYMLKAAHAKETEHKYEDAVKIYEALIKDYPLVPQVNEAKKYIELAKKGKSIYNL